MKITQFRTQLLFCSCLACGMFMSGCSDGDYDLSSVDAKLGIGSELSLPSDNSVIVLFDDIFDLGNSDIITTTENGDYVLGKKPEEVSPVNVYIDPLLQDINLSDGATLPIELPAAITPFQGQTIDVSDLPIEVAGAVSLLEYTFSAENLVKDVSHIKIGNGSDTKITVDITLPVAVKAFKRLKIQMPQNLEFVYLGNLATLSDDNVLDLGEYDAATKGSMIHLEFYLTGIKIHKYSDVNYVKFVPATAIAKPYVELKCNIEVDLKAKTLEVPSTTTINVSGLPKLDPIYITGATGIFDPDIELDDLGTVTINDIPDFLSDENSNKDEGKELVVDIANPQIWLTLKSNMPLGGIIDAKITSDTYPQGVIINGIELAGKPEGATTDAETKIVLCRKAPENLNGYTPIEKDDLSRLIEKLRNGMQLKFSATQAKAKQDVATVDMGVNYHLQPVYEFTAPLALGDKARIVYNSSVDDWNKDLKDFNLSAGSVLTLEAAVDNQAPADLEINITPLGLDGQPISTLVVKPIQNKVAAGAAADKIKYEISDPNGTGLNQLDGIEYELLVTSPASGSSEKGKVLNKNQKIVIKTQSLHLSGKVIVDAD